MGKRYQAVVPERIQVGDAYNDSELDKLKILGKFALLEEYREHRKSK